MNFLEKTYQSLEHYILKNASIQSLNVAAVSKGKTKSNQLNTTPISVERQTLKEWKLALLLASDQDSPDRSTLQDLYANLMLDNHLASTIDSRILHTLRSKFKLVNANNEEQDDLTALFDRPWFEDFLRLCLKSIYEGATLIELFELNSITKELQEVEEIPMAHFNARKGIILKNIGDTKGWPYKEGALAKNYLQIGKDKDLGMLAQIAPVVLTKKKAFGSWLDYLDKYGVGSLFITTEHQDPKEIERLEQAAKNFKASGWLVSNGNENFEVKGNEAGNPQNFDLLIERVNSEISKRILGGTGMTDEKAFVGSAEIQYQLTKDRYDSDMVFVANVINMHLIPRLIKISSVYAGLASAKFVWKDEPEDVSKLTDNIAKLAPYFDLDAEELSQRLGITLLSQRVQQPSFGQPTASRKKKS